MVNEIVLQIEQHHETGLPKKQKMMPLKRTGLNNLTTAKKKKEKKKATAYVPLYVFFFAISMVNTSSTCQCTLSMKSKAEICHKSYLAAREIQIAVSTSARGALTAMLKP